MGQLLEWRSGVRDLTCRVCAWTGDGEYVADVAVPERKPCQAVRCPDCGSIELLEDNMDSSPDDASVDGYTEAGAGIEAIAGSIAQVDPTTVRRFLDVGCNYGFALDIGRFLHGWDVVGVEPSYAGARGARELDLDIRNVYLDDEVDVGDDFDLILASEVLEHVPDPLGFLQMLGRRLTPTGSLILTTPAAEIVSKDEPLGEALVALSPGFHVFLASVDGLERLLHRAGFAAVQVSRSRGAMKAAASFDPEAISRFRDEPVDHAALEPYYAWRADRAPYASSLAAGMATRHLRLLVSFGRWDEVAPSAVRAMETMKARHGLDLDDPDKVRRTVIESRSVPWNLHGLAFALGMTALLHDKRPGLAADYFELVITGADLWESQAQILDPDSQDLRFQARVHLAIALTDINPAAAARVALDLPRHSPMANPATAAVVATRQCRLFVDLVTKGHLEAGRLLAGVASDLAPALAASDDPSHRRTGLDGLYALGMLRLNTGEVESARTWFGRCLDACRSHSDEHADRLAGAAERHLTITEERALSRSAVPLAVVKGRALTVSHHLDVYWCDASGTFLEGWALVHEAPATRVEVRSGARTVLATPVRREDLCEFYPGPAHTASAGFTAYLPGAPRGEVQLLLHTELGVAEVLLTLPDHPLPALEEFDAIDVMKDRFAPFLDRMPPGPILLVGQRQSTEAEWLSVISDFEDREVVGVDIHAGWGVDVIGDAHQLSRVFEPGTFAGVLSASLLEHVAAPWLVARETARVLAPGGLAFQAAPWMWPTHSLPNDFWRFAPAALELLFGRDLGFEVLGSGGGGGVVTVPLGPWRADTIKMPTTSSHAMSWVVSRKVSDPDPSIHWPYDPASGEELARAYPVDALPAAPDNESRR